MSNILPAEVRVRGVLACFSDSSYGAPKPVAGAITTYNGAPIQWQSARLQVSALSSCESEILGAARAAMTVMNLRDVLEFIMDRPIAVPITLWNDNTACCALSNSGQGSRRIRHIALRISFLKELVEEGRLRVSWLSGENMIADILTKRLASAALHHRFRACLVDN